MLIKLGQARQEAGKAVASLVAVGVGANGRLIFQLDRATITDGCPWRDAGSHSLDRIVGLSPH